MALDPEADQVPAGDFDRPAECAQPAQHTEDTVRKSKAFLSTITLLTLCLLAGTAQAQDSSPLAVLMAVQGPVTVVSADGSTRAANFGMHLHPGDTVQTGADASAEILFSSGNLVQVGANSQTGVGQPRTASAPSGEAFASVQGFLKLKDSRGTSSVGTLRSAGSREELSLRHPCQSRVLGDELSFAWSAQDLMGGLKLTIYGDAGVVYETEISEGDQFSYPTDAPALESGVSYSWTVETTDPLVIPALRSTTGFFELVGAEEQKKLDEQLSAVEAEAGSGSAHLYRASVYYGHGMLDAAILETSAALQDDAENDELRSILARLLTEAGRSSEAVEEYDRLLEVN